MPLPRDSNSLTHSVAAAVERDGEVMGKKRIGAANSFFFAAPAAARKKKKAKESRRRRRSGAALPVSRLKALGAFFKHYNGILNGI